MRYKHRVVGGRLVLRSLVKGSSGVYFARIRDTRTGRIYTRTTRERGKERAERCALTLAENLLDELQGGGQVRPRRFAEASAEWLSELTVAESTRRGYGLNFDVLKRHFRGYVGSVDRDAVKSFVASRRRDGLSPRTISKQLIQLRSFLRWCIDEGYALADPTVRIRAPSGPSREGIALVYDEARELLECTQPVVKTVSDRRRGSWKQTFGVPYLRLFILISLHTGLRKANVLHLAWPQINLEKRFMRFEAGESANPMKMRRAHVVPIHRELETELRRTLRGQNRVSQYVLGARRGDICKAFQGALKRSTLSYKLIPHDLRHTFSTWVQSRFPYLMAEYLCARAVQQVGGRYYHPPFDECLKAIDSLPWIEGRAEKKESQAV